MDNIPKGYDSEGNHTGTGLEQDKIYVCDCGNEMSEYEYENIGVCGECR